MITQMTYPDGGVHNFSYDETLAHLKKIEADGEDFVSALSYNKSGVVTQMTYANDTVQNWSFDNRKRIAHIEVVKGSSQSITDLNYTLNGVGDILAVNDNVYEYDGFDRIVGAKTLIPGEEDDSKLVAASFGTSEGVGPIEVELESRSYNPDADLNSDGRVNGADHAKANFIALDTIYDIESFAYDKNGNRTKLVQNGDVYEYSYGERNRLESIRVTQKGEEAARLFAEYKYDANGNTTRRTIHPMNSEPQVLDLEYDTLNRLVQSRLDGAVTSYSYDNAGNRLVKTTPEKTTLYLRHGQIAVAMDIELPEDASVEKGRVNRYVLSGDLLAGRITRVTAADGVESVEKSYYYLDHLNSTKAVTDDDGVLEVLYEYRAFGEQLKRLDSAGSETGDSAKYSYGGKELDAGSDLYYFNARYYDATTGRFINVDPIQDGSNWYVYVRNNPLGLVDPTGLEDTDLKENGEVGIFLQIHKVLWNNYHASIKIVPKDQDKWKNHDYFKNNVDDNGNHYATIGAGPVWGDLYSDFNRGNDIEKEKVEIIILDIDGRDENEVIEAILEAEKNYTDDEEYDLFPKKDSTNWLRNGLNSNSFVRGLLEFLGIEAPDVQSNVPGYDKPLSEENFTSDPAPPKDNSTSDMISQY